MGVTGLDVRGDLLERGDALATLERAAREAVGGLGSVVAVTGAAGVGKTRVLGELAPRAAEAGLRVLTARGVQLEHGFAFGVTRQLLDPVIMRAAPADRRRWFAGAASLAEPLFGGDPTPVDATGFAMLNGLWWLVASLAVDRPVALLVDDVQWADAASARWLSFLASRLPEVPVLAVVAGRTDEPDAPVEWPAMAERRIEFLPLSVQATGVLLGDRLETPPAAEFVAACHVASGGNPFLVTELARELQSRGVAPAREEASTVARVTPDTVARLVVGRLAAQPDEVARLARAISVLGEGVPLVDAADLAGVDPATARQAAARLAELGILRPTTPLTFEHPIVREAVYQSILPVLRAGLHRDAAEALGRRGEDVDRRAAHLLRTDPAADPAVVAVLTQAAAAAAARGAFDAAAGYLARSLAEPPAASDRAAVLADLGHAELQCGDARAAEHLSEAAACAGDPLLRLRASGELARLLLLTGDVDAAIAVADEARAPAADSAASLDVEIELLSAASIAGAPVWAQLSGRLRALADVAWQAGDSGRPLLALLATDEIRRGGTQAATGELARVALADDVLLDRGPDYPPFLHACYSAIRGGHLDLAIEVLGRAIGEAGARGSLLGFGFASCYRGMAHVLHGDLDAADADLRIALDAARDNGWTLLEWQVLNFWLMLLAERGEVAQAQAELERGGLEGDLEASMVTTGLLSARAAVRYAQGRWRDAYDDFIECGRLEEPYSKRAQNVWWRADAAMALAHLGEHQQALILADEELEMAQSWDDPVSVGRALHARGLAKGERGVEDLEAAAQTLDGVYDLGLASCLVDLGAALRRSKRRSEARQPLRRALELAERLGARGYAERARVELAASGARPRTIPRTGVDSLTPSELRIARLAAGGLSNPEIAQHLFVTRKTVESHLGHIYLKLDIKRREQLAAALER